MKQIPKNFGPATRENTRIVPARTGSPQGPRLYRLLKTLGGPVVGRLWRHKVIDAENMPEGPAIIASNHLAFCDSIFIPLAVQPTVNFLAKSDYFTGEGITGKATAAFFRSIGQLPMDRTGGNKSSASLLAALKVLTEGGVVGIYPEGTRSPDGNFYRTKIGVARLALESGAPVIPIGQLGTNLVQPAGTNYPHLHHNGQRIRVTTIIGKPLDYSHLQPEAANHTVQRTIADNIGEAIRALTGQKYVPVAADRVKTLMSSEGLTASEAVARLLTP